MLGMMLKDFYETFCIKKNLIGFIFTILLFYTVFFLMPGKYTIVLLVVLSVPSMGVVPLQYSIERDEISQFDQILLTYPISRKHIVMTKVLETYLFTVLCLLMFSIPVLLISIYGYHIIDVKQGLELFLVGLMISLLLLPINNTGFFILGNKKGSMMYMILLVLCVVGFLLFNLFIGVDSLLAIPLSDWLFYGGLLAVVLNVLGYFSCLKVYEIKHS